MINDELRKGIENAQRTKCFISSAMTLFSAFLWLMLLNSNDMPKNAIIATSIFSTLFTIFAFILIFCNIGKETFKRLENDPTKS